MDEVVDKSVRLAITEEYGYRHWLAEMTEEEYRDLLRRWETIRGLTCLVPVNLIIPQARVINPEEMALPYFTHHGHIHEYDDSSIEGSDYRIPYAEYFWMDGKRYEESEYFPEWPRGDEQT